MSQTSPGETIVSKIAIDAPGERIFEAIIDPKQRTAWWGGGTFKSERVESDLRLGGRWTMVGMTGDRPFSCNGEYREIERPRVLAFTWNPS